MATTNVQDHLGRVKEIANYLAISRSKVYQMMESGQLPFIKLGKSRRVRWADVQRLIDENTVAQS